MRTRTAWITGLIVLSFSASLSAQSQLSIRAASDQPVQGWQRMQVEHSNRFVWVAPTEAVTANDIQVAAPEINADGERRIAIVFTDEGAKKARDLSIEQRKKLVALVVDNKVVWAPIVQSEITKQSVLTGSASTGLTQEEVDRIMAILR